MTGRIAVPKPAGNAGAIVEIPMYEALVGGILKEAARDYLHAKSGRWEAPYIRLPEEEWDKARLAELDEFFASDWFVSLTGLDASSFVAGLEDLLVYPEEDTNE